MKSLGANDKAISALTAASSLADTDVLPIVNGGSTKSVTLNVLDAYIESRGRVNNASVTTPGAGFASDTYLVGSSVAIPNGRLQAKSMYRCKFSVTKTAAGIAAPIITVRIGTAGSTADTSRGALTFAAQTAAIDQGFFEIFCTWRTVGSGTTAVLQSMGTLSHALSITGLSTDVTGMKTATSAGFDSTTSGSIIGCSVNGGTSAAWTIALVQAELYNLA